MKTRILLLCAVLALSACMTPQQRAAYDLEQARIAAQEAARIDAERKYTCANMGAPEGSQNYYDCRMKLEQMALQKDIADQQLDEAQRARYQEDWHHYEDQRQAEKFRKDIKEIKKYNCTSPFPGTTHTDCN